MLTRLNLDLCDAQTFEQFAWEIFCIFLAVSIQLIPKSLLDKTRRCGVDLPFVPNIDGFYGTIPLFISDSVQHAL